MKVRALLVAVALCFSLSALAETITFTASDNSVIITGTVNNPPTDSLSGLGTEFLSSDATVNGTPLAVEFFFYNPTTTMSSSGTPLDFEVLLQSDSTMLVAGDGIMLYSGAESAPTLLPGTYDLDADNSVPGDLPGGTLVITADAPVNVAPEPSSFLLLGTGILGLAGAARRKFINA